MSMERTIPDEALKLSLRGRMLALFCCFAGGACCAAALPPLNCGFAAFCCLLPLYYAASVWHTRFLALCGWVWGLGWALFAYQFLREIDPCIPYLLAPVMALWPMVWALMLPMLMRYTLYPVAQLAGKFAEREAYRRQGFAFWRVALFCTGSAMLFALIEATRAHLFVWNDLSVTQWRNLPLLQISAYCGSYGITFVVALLNSALFALAFLKRGWRWCAVCAALYLVLCAWGVWRVAELGKVHGSVVWRPAMIQGNLSQRRHATQEQALEALRNQLKMSFEIAGEKPEIVLWPESAVPVPYRSSGVIGRHFRSGIIRFLAETRIPMLIGSLDYAELGSGEYGITNSALLLDADSGDILAKHDKFVRVPFGEYIPGRRLLPKKLIEAIDMGRDLTPGASLQPLKVASEVRAGIAICYEGVFSHLARTLARRGANVLVVLSNDAWYPESSELEQHLANAVIRSVETGLPMVRCNNNGASGIVSPAGVFTAGIGSRRGSSEIVREIASGVVEVRLAADPEPTIFVRYGQWLLILFGVICAAWCVFAARCCCLVYRRRFLKCSVPHMGR